MKRRWRSVVIAIGVLIILVMFGTWFYGVSEGWRAVDSFYFTCMTITTVGYGDYVPTHDLSKIVTVMYSMISIPVVLFVFGFFAEHYFESKIIDLEKRLKEVMLEEKKIEEGLHLPKDVREF